MQARQTDLKCLYEIYLPSISIRCGHFSVSCIPHKVTIQWICGFRLTADQNVWMIEKVHGLQWNVVSKKDKIIWLTCWKSILRTQYLRYLIQRSRSSSGRVKVRWRYLMFVGNRSDIPLIRLSQRGLEHVEQIGLLQVKQRMRFSLQHGHSYVKNHKSLDWHLMILSTHSRPRFLIRLSQSGQCSFWNAGRYFFNSMATLYWADVWLKDSMVSFVLVGKWYHRMYCYATRLQVRDSGYFISKKLRKKQIESIIFGNLYK